MSTPTERIHDNRVRAESFGSLPQTYDRYRPTYPPALIDDLLAGDATAVRSVLDVGCGTGRVATLLAERGVHVLGVEVDERMAAVARAHGVEVEVSGFEDWPDRGRRFDLLVSGQAWHWVDPVRGAQAAFGLLRPGGRIALFWNIGGFAAGIATEIDRVYATEVPQMGRPTLLGANRSPEPYLASLRAAGFTDLEQRSYEWTQDYSRAEWVALAGTHSDHSTLPDDVRDRLLTRLGTLIDSHGGRIEMRYHTAALFGSHRGPAPSVAG